MNMATSASQQCEGSKELEIVSILTTTITAVGSAKGLLSSTLAQGVLTSVANICVLIRDSIKNKNDFVDVVIICREASLRIAIASSGQRKLSEPIVRALEDLQRVFQEIIDVIEMKRGRSLEIEVGHVSLAHGEITGWKQEINRSVHILDTELGAMTGAKFNQSPIMLSESAGTIFSNAGSSPYQSEPLPPIPAVFFGRRGLVKKSTKALCNGSHVALTGAAGIGKSSIAKAILYNAAVKTRYEDHRYFISFDEFKAESMNFNVFINKIAISLGIQPSTQARVFSHLESLRVFLIVMDNAETFLEAQYDSALIANAIELLGRRSPSGQIVLASRNQSLPNNLDWKRFTVPGLNLYSSRKAFLAIYKRDMSPVDAIDTILTNLDYHPLSINLIANTSHRNKWSAQEINHNWRTQRTTIFYSGLQGDSQSLECSIELSMKSPCINQDKIAQDLLKAIAFLPQGIPYSKLEDIIPSAGCGIRATIDTLCKMSLTHHDGDFVTMLSPFRMHIQQHHLGGKIPPYNFLYFEDIRRYYHKNMPLPPTQPTKMLEREDINAEWLVIHDFTIAGNEERNFQHCLGFFHYLLTHNRRPCTKLGPVLLRVALSSKPIFPITNAFSHWSRLRLLVNIVRPHVGRSLSMYKAACFIAVARCGMSGGLFQDARQLCKAAICDVLKTGYSWAERGLLSVILVQAKACAMLGLFSEAEEILTGFLRLTDGIPWTSPRKTDGVTRENAKLTLAMTLALRGKSKESEELIVKLIRDLEEKKPLRLDLSRDALCIQGIIFIFNGNRIRARHCFQRIYSEFLLGDDDGAQQRRIQCLVYLSETAESQTEGDSLLRKAAEIEKNVIASDAVKFFKNTTNPSLACTRIARAADGHNFQNARKYTRHASVLLQKYSSDGYSYPRLQYIAARTELLAGNYTEAQKLFIKAMELFKETSCARFTAWCHRALGEIALLEQDNDRADECFAEVMAICNFMGLIHPQFLYVCLGAYKLPDDEFPGWTMFYKDRSSSS